MGKKFYAIRYRRGSKRGDPMTVTLFQNPSSSDKDEMIRQAKNTWNNRASTNVLAVAVVSFVEDGLVWSNGDDIQRQDVG